MRAILLCAALVSCAEPRQSREPADIPARVAENIESIGAPALCAEGERLVSERQGDGPSVSWCEASADPSTSASLQD